MSLNRAGGAEFGSVAATDIRWEKGGPTHPFPSVQGPLCHIHIHNGCPLTDCQVPHLSIGCDGGGGGGGGGWQVLLKYFFKLTDEFLQPLRCCFGEIWLAPPITPFLHSVPCAVLCHIPFFLNH